MANLLNRIKQKKETGNKERWKIKISGIVQGVGFRPFVYRIANIYKIYGIVRNIDGDVFIEAQSNIKSLISFVNHIWENPPRSAKIRDLKIQKISMKTDEAGFAIMPSASNPKIQTATPSPDIAICADCKEELFETGNQRYLHPFISCTDCGPRFSINLAIPFDRQHTTMSLFELCGLCKKEYNEPLDKRFHSQTNCCHQCGPFLSIYSIYHPDLCINKVTYENIGKIDEACELLQNDGVMLLKGIGGYHLICKASSSRAIGRIRQIKKRVKKPLAVMVKDLGSAYEIATITSDERRLLASPAAPIVLLKQRKDTSLSPLLAPGNSKIGVMLAYSPVHKLLFKYINEPLVATSGNLKGQPIEYLNKESRKALAGKVDIIMDHNRRIQNPCDDSVVRVVDRKNIFIRRARGFVPEGIELDFEAAPTLGCGGDMKATFCLASGKTAYASQFVGDLDSWHNFNRYAENIEKMIALLDIEPEIISHDMHPGYRSTQFALSKYPERTIETQHHHAHIVSCMMEKHINEKVIGIALDGAGWGTDGKLWGSEFFICDREKFERIAHLRYMPMPGGDKCTKSPYRMATAVACTIENENTAKKILKNIDVPGHELSLIEKQIKVGLNTPYTSSMGRLFDILAAITGISRKVTFEGEAAIELEEISAESSEDGHYEFSIFDIGGEKIIDYEPVLSNVINDMEKGFTAEDISAKFHNSIVFLINELCLQLLEKYNINKVILSGGVFQNKIILENSFKLLEHNGFDVYTNNILPINDNGISLGQIGIANSIALSSGKLQTANYKLQAS